MAGAVPIPEETLSDDSPLLGRGPSLAWLIYIGSSENDFREAGGVWSLENVSKIRFGRVSGSDMQSEREADYLGRRLDHPGYELLKQAPLVVVSREEDRKNFKVPLGV